MRIFVYVRLGVGEIKEERGFLSSFVSCPTWIRTKTNRTKTCCATITP